MAIDEAFRANIRVMLLDLGQLEVVRRMFIGEDRSVTSGGGQKLQTLGQVPGSC